MSIEDWMEPHRLVSPEGVLHLVPSDKKAMQHFASTAILLSVSIQLSHQRTVILDRQHEAEEVFSI